MKLVSILSLTLVFASFVHSQSTVTVSGFVGRVGPGSIEVQTRGSAYPGVEVTLTRLDDPAVKFTTTTDADGRFRFDGISSGRYRVDAVPPRQDNVQSPYATIEVGSAPVTIDLAVNVVAGPACSNCGIRETVTVAAGQEQPVELVSKSVDVVGRQEMRDRADITMTDSLRTIPGLRVQQLGGFGKVASIKTRGLRNQDTAFLIDGVRFRDPTAISGDATSFLSDVTLTSVDRVEVLRGPGSSIYGTNAIGGVVDLRTPKASIGTHGQISGALGGLGLGRGRANLSHGTRDGRFGIGGAVSRTVYSKGIDGDDRAANTGLQFRTDVRLSRFSATGSLLYSNADVRLNTDPDTLGPLPGITTIINAVPNVNFTSDANDPDRVQRSRAFTGKVAMTIALHPKVTIDGLYNGLTTNRNNDNGPLGAGFQSASTSIFEGRIDTLQTKLTWRPRLSSLTIGYEFEREKYRNEGRTPSGTGNFFTRAGQQSNTIFAQGLLGLDDGRLQIAGGVRVQQYSLASPGFSLTNAPYNSLTLADPPRAVTYDGAVSYLIRATGTKLRSHVGNGYRVPSLYERFGTFYSTFGGAQFIAIGDPFLGPERSVGFDIGADQEFATGRVRLSAVYFYTRLTDVIGYANVVPPIGSTTRPFGGYLNQKGGIARGGEFSGRVTPDDRTDIFASYTYTNSDQRQPQVAGSRITRTLGIPDHEFTFSVTRRFGRAWANFDFMGTSSYLAPIYSNSIFQARIYRFEGNRRGDLTGGYSFKADKRGRAFRVFATVENVLNQEYFENGFRTARANARVGIAFGF
ncbi:MAG: TonB-dependent receptor [Acidobacteria bacterium]|nr:TonB-dependent receptor [Acidobacteriota bacterium]MCW5948654.1 TonB-dependent receptor [Pyrinomonadaceae bacterium]